MATTPPKPASSTAYVKGQYVANLIGVLIAAFLLAALVFDLFNEGGAELRAVQLFLGLFVASFAVIQPYTAIGNARRDLLLGKWKLGDDAGGGAEAVVSPWRRLGWRNLFVAVIAGALAAAAVPLLGAGPFGLWTITGISSLVLLVVSTPIIGGVLPRDQRSLAVALAQADGGAAFAGPKPGRAAYFLWEHFLPWVVLQIVINVSIGVKQYTFEGAKPEAVEAGGIPASVVATDFGIVFSVILFFIWLASSGQVRPDVRLGRVPRAEGKPSKILVQGLWLRVLVVIGVMVVSTLVLGTLATAALPLVGLATLSVVAACTVKGLAAVGACVAGCTAGIWWGREQETRLLEAGAAEA